MTNSQMKISRLYTYPIKSLRGVEVNSIPVTKHGFPYDRRYMLLKVIREDDGTTTFKNMAVAHFYDMALFTTAVSFPTDEDEYSGSITVTYHSPDNKGETTSFEIPLKPSSTDDLETIQVDMHRSPTAAHKMPAEYCEWFSSCFGYDVVLAYLGNNLRKVLMTSRNNAQKSATKPAGWLSSLTTTVTSVVPGLGANGDDHVTFADCAPYLVVSEKSLENVHSRLSEGKQMDMRKFRPNIAIAGAPEAWDEDFWGQLTITSSSMSPPQQTLLACEQNCGRCKSINVDYKTGETAPGDEGEVLKRLSKDRRVDPGMKWNPIFGRYSFLDTGSEGHVLSVGDEVVVSRRNEERTRFDWEGLCTK